MVRKYKHPEHGDIVEAIQYNKDNLGVIEEWGKEYIFPHDSLNLLLIKSNVGTVLAFVDDYVCKDSVKGFHPVMRHKFETQYVPLEIS